MRKPVSTVRVKQLCRSRYDEGLPKLFPLMKDEENPSYQLVEDAGNHLGIWTLILHFTRHGVLICTPKIYNSWMKEDNVAARFARELRK